MKLKKIASLALAGIMAVSMLAGCKDGTNQEDPSSSSSEVTVTSGAAAALNSAMTRNGDMLSFKDDSDLDKNLEAYFKLNPIKGDEWNTANYGKIYENADNMKLNNVVSPDYWGIDNLNGVVTNKVDIDKSAAVVGMFNTKVYTKADALKTVGAAIDQNNFATDTDDKTDGKEFTYSGKASIVQVSSAGGSASVWVVVAVVTKGYEKV